MDSQRRFFLLLFYSMLSSDWKIGIGIGYLAYQNKQFEKLYIHHLGSTFLLINTLEPEVLHKRNPRPSSY